MNVKILKEGLLIMGVAIICAIVTNLLAGDERRLDWIRHYPDAMTVAPVESAAPASVSSDDGLAEAAAEQDEVSIEQVRKRFPIHPEQAWETIEREDVWLLFRAGAPFLDARRTKDYLRGHIAGARNFPVWESEIDGKIQDLLAAVPMDQPVVAYCSGGHCDDSKLLAERLYMSGHNNVLIYLEGYPDWEAAGRPISAGEEP